MLNDSTLSVIREIFEYAENNPGTSYYDIEKVAYESDNYKWIRVLRSKKTRFNIAELIKSIRKKNGIKYKNNRSDSMLAAIKAKDDFFARHNGVMPNEYYD